MGMLRTAMLKESRKRLDEMTLDELQTLQVKSSARLLVLKESAKRTGLPDEFLTRAEEYVQRVGKKIEARRRSAILAKKKELLARIA